MGNSFNQRIHEISERKSRERRAFGINTSKLLEANQTILRAERYHYSELEKITRRIPSGRQYANDRAPTLEEIRAILRYDDPRIKPVVLTMVSSGIRVGAWDYLKWEDVKPIQDKSGNVIAASLKVYAGTKDEYKTFITPEAYRSLKAWMDSRAQAGEKVGPKSWVMRDLWEEGEGDGKQGRKKVDKHGAIPKRGIATVPKKLSSIGVTRLIERALFAQGIRGKKEDHAEEPRGEPRRKRYEFQTAHGFRKYFNTICDRYMKTLFVEFLMGHNTGLKESYNRAKEDELLEEYLKAVPALTVLERPQTEQTSIPSEAVSEDIAALKRQVQELEQSIQFATRQNIMREIRTCLKNYFGAISQEEKQRQKARLLQGFGFTEEEIEEIERLHNAVYEELKIPSHVKDKETYLSEQFRRIGERPRLKELFTDYFARINEVTERVYQMTKSRTSGHANFFDFAKEDINELFP
jgi:integrase